MRAWRRLLPILILVVLVYLYIDERRFVEGARPKGFSTEAPSGSVFEVKLQKNLELGKVHLGQKIRFLPAKALPYGSMNVATLPADAVLEARVKQILDTTHRHRTVVIEFERLRAGGRVVPLSAFLTVRDGELGNIDEAQREIRGAIGAIIARNAKGNPLIVIAGYLSGTYIGDFCSRRTDAPVSFFSSELGRTIPSDIKLQVQLHRRAYIPR
jgi:hypothetical protein